MKQHSPIYSTSREAEAAFYHAFETCDISAMMKVWNDDDEIICIHPMGVRSVGRASVKSSWLQIFSQDIKLNFKISDQFYFAEKNLAVHLVHENILVGDATHFQPPVLATNIYINTKNGWRLAAHHASPSPEPDVHSRVHPGFLH